MLNPLPQLRTVRDTPALPPAAPASPAAPKLIDHPRLPAAAKQLLGEAVQAGILTNREIREFLGRVGDRVIQLNTREGTANALVQFEVLTAHQKSRLVSGQTHGLILGNYRVLDRLGGGTVGTVFTAIQPFLQRKVAIKVLSVDPEHHESTAERFRDESRILAKLAHPNVVGVHDAGEVPGAAPGEMLWYTVLELVDGGDVEQFLYEHGPQPLPQAVLWGVQIAAGLSAIHAGGIVHRDLKPGNLLLTTSRQIKIADFGLARQPTSTRTPCQTLLGTLEFLAPEQLHDPSTAGPPADVYSFGAILFWMLSGQLPYPDGLNSKEILDFLATDQPRRLKEVRAGLPVSLDELIAKMLVRNPGQRPNLEEIVRVLRECQSDAAAEVQLIPQPVSSNAGFQAMSSLLALRPGESSGRQERLANYCERLSLALASAPRYARFGDPCARRGLALAAKLHNLGISALPDSLLSGAEDERIPSEVHAYRQHPLHGDRFLRKLSREDSACGDWRTLCDVVRHHHERWDGTGYPDRLAGEAVPLAARVVAIADTYDREREQGRDHAQALLQIESLSGTAFDPSIVKHLRACQHEWQLVYLSIPNEPDAEIIDLASGR